MLNPGVIHPYVKPTNSTWVAFRASYSRFLQAWLPLGHFFDTETYIFHTFLL